VLAPHWLADALRKEGAGDAEGLGRERGVDIGRAHPPYTNWARITIGLPSENLRAQNALRTGLKET
jgi:histidinol-phosphate/aromatic aminotransferase/cobyric acid decarboxylase-like protein